MNLEITKQNILMLRRYNAKNYKDILYKIKNWANGIFSTEINGTV